MKKRFYSGAAVLALGLFIFCSFVSDIGKPANTVDAYYKAIVSQFFDEPHRWNEPGDFPDTNLKINVDGRKLFPKAACRTSPSYIYYAFYIPLDSNAYWNWASFKYDKKAQSRFKTLFGQNIVASRFTLKAKSPWQEPGEVNEFRFYSAAGIEAAFKKLYKKPATKFEGCALQGIYNASLKSYCREAANVIAGVKSKDKDFQDLAKQYLQAAKTDTTFDGQEFTYKACEKLGVVVSGNSETDCLAKYSYKRIVGIMLRRQCDGTLPVLLKWFKVILKDYDPEYYKTIGTRF